MLQRLVIPVFVEEPEVPVNGVAQVQHRGIVVEVDFLILQRPPQPFDVYVVQCSLDPVHADLDPLGLENRGEGLGRELASLVRVKDRWDAPTVDRRGCTGR